MRDQIYILKYLHLNQFTLECAMEISDFSYFHWLILQKLPARDKLVESSLGSVRREILGKGMKIKVLKGTGVKGKMVNNYMHHRENTHSNKLVVLMPEGEGYLMLL